MKKTYTMIVFILLALAFFPGCEMFKGSCLTVGGGKGDIQGEITYCFNSAKTADLDTPVMEGETEDGDTEEFFGFNVGEIQKIIDKIRGKDREADTAEPEAGVSAMTAPPERPEAAEPTGHPVEILKGLLEE